LSARCPLALIEVNTALFQHFGPQKTLSLKKIAKPYFREMDMDPINGEPLCAEYLILKDRNTGVKKRADIGFRGRRRAILVTLAKDVKDYKPGKTADAGTKGLNPRTSSLINIKLCISFCQSSFTFWCFFFS
jgi:hypothetical protein